MLVFYLSNIFYIINYVFSNIFYIINMFVDFENKLFLQIEKIREEQGISKKEACNEKNWLPKIRELNKLKEKMYYRRAMEWNFFVDE